MIVRINQFDAPPADSTSGWHDGPRTGRIVCPWPDQTHAYEILIMDNDERGRPLSRAYREQRMRQMIVQTMIALTDPPAQWVLRADGELMSDALLPYYGLVACDRCNEQFGLSPALKLADDTASSQGSIRLAMDERTLLELCQDESLDMTAQVRLRIFAVPPEMVGPLLDMSDLDDERWPDILSAVHFVVQTTHNLESLHVLTQRFDPQAVRERLTDRLTRFSTQRAGS